MYLWDTPNASLMITERQNKMNIDGDYIKNLILKKAMTQKEFAEFAGLSRTGLNRMLNTGICKVTSLRKLSDALEIEPEELLRTKADEEK